MKPSRSSGIILVLGLTFFRTFAQSTYEPYTFTTLAGVTGGSADGIGSAARFGGDIGMAMDNAGNLYVADTVNGTIRKVTPTGMVTTLAGLAGVDGSGDGTGSSARFRSPTGVTVDGAGTVYVADSGNNTIRKVTPTGVVTTLAGLAAQFDTDGNLVMAGCCSADGTGSDARFNCPTGVAVDSDGYIYVADQKNATIRKVTPAGEVTTLAGLAGVRGSADLMGGSAQFNQPTGVAVDIAGNVYVADQGNATVRKVTPEGVVTTLAGRAGVQGTVDGTWSEARFRYPTGVSVDSLGNVYVADVDMIRKMTSAGMVTTLAGLSGRGVVVDSVGNLYAGAGSGAILKMTLAG